MKDKEIRSESHQEEPEQPTQKLELQIVRHRQLFAILKNPSEMWRVLLSVFAITVILFFGLLCVVLSVKSIYPYNAIQTNMYGATTMKSEDKEVIYWLFNTAELWANSGVEVRTGDELTIRASGTSYTALHHLVDAAKNNEMPTDKWVRTDGYSDINNDSPIKERDSNRRRYRISSGQEEGKLLMQIIPEDGVVKDGVRRWIEEYEIDDVNGEQHKSGLEDNRIEIIGKGREKLRIKRDGILHFAVNDIVLTDKTITAMYQEFIDDLIKQDTTNSIKKYSTDIMSALKNINSGGYNSLVDINNKLKDLEVKGLDGNAIGIKDYGKNKSSLRLGYYPKEKENYPLINELVYYKQYGFRDAWFLDNLGSFLIVIERKKAQ